MKASAVQYQKEHLGLLTRRLKSTFASFSYNDASFHSYKCLLGTCRQRSTSTTRCYYVPWQRHSRRSSGNTRTNAIPRFHNAVIVDSLLYSTQNLRAASYTSPAATLRSQTHVEGVDARCPCKQATRQHFYTESL